MENKRNESTPIIEKDYADDITSSNSLSGDEIKNVELERKNLKYGKGLTLNEYKSSVHDHTKSKVPLISSIILDPITRYRIYGTFPSKFLIHVALVFLCTTFTMMQNEIDNELLNPQIVAFNYYFLNDESMDDFNKLAEEYPKRKDFYSISDLNDFVSNSV